MSVGSLEWRRQEGAGGRRRQGGRRPPPLALRGCTHIWRAVKGMSNAMPDKIPADAKADFIGKVLNRPANRTVPVSAEGVEEEGHGWAGRGQTGRHGEGQVDSGEEKKGGVRDARRTRYLVPPLSTAFSQPRYPPLLFRAGDRAAEGDEGQGLAEPHRELLRARAPPPNRASSPSLLHSSFMRAGHRRAGRRR